MGMQARAKHKLCRRIGSCIWGNPKCPSNKRPYPAGPHGKGRQRKLSTYGQLLQEKQKLKAFYGLTERQLRAAYLRAKAGTGFTHEKLQRNLELRLDAIVFRSGLAPSVFAAKQAVSHRHIRVDGKVVDRPSCRIRAGQVISMSADKSPALATAARNSNVAVPHYLEVDRENLKVTVVAEPALDDIQNGIEIMRVIEFYAR